MIDGGAVCNDIATNIKLEATWQRNKCLPSTPYGEVEELQSMEVKTYGVVNDKKL